MKAFLLILLFIGCTSQDMAKEFGGSVTINLPNCEKLINATWKESDLWYLTRHYVKGEEPPNNTYTFGESSSWGILKGTVKLVESCHP